VTALWVRRLVCPRKSEGASPILNTIPPSAPCLSTFDRTGDEKEMTADVLRIFIEMWMGQQEWDHLEDDDFDCEKAEKKSFDALKAAWLSADIFSRAAPS
jgi:hypothetical protein